MLLRLLRTEGLKLRRSVVWLLLPVSPALAALAGYMAVRLDAITQWEMLLPVMALLHALLFLPLLTGIYAALVCRYEHVEGGWKLMLSLPVSRSALFGAKLITVMGLLAATQLLFLLAVVLLGSFMDFADPIPWKGLLLSATGGWLACASLAALQLLVSLAFHSFAAPMAINVILTMPNILVANSAEYGPYYPWAQPLLAMIPKNAQELGAFLIPAESLLYTVGGGFVLFAAAGWWYFGRKSV